MKGFNFINSSELRDNQLDDVAKLLCDTGYYEFSSRDNQLNLSTLEFQKLQTLKPYQKYTQVLVNEGKVAGFFIAGTKWQFLEVEKNIPNWYRNDPELIASIEKIIHYYTHEILDTDLVSYGIALSSEYRGKKLFHLLNEQRKIIAKEEHCTRIAFVVWETNPAVATFKHCGAQIIGEIDLRDTQFKDRLFKCVFNV